MKIVSSYARLLDRSKMSQMEIVEYTGRICYKSHDNTKPGSAEQFCRAMKKNGHFATLEQGWVHLYVNVSNTFERAFDAFIGDSSEFKYIEVSKIPTSSLLSHSFLVSGSFRGLIGAFGNPNETRPVFKAIFNKLVELYPVIFEDIKDTCEVKESDQISIREINENEIFDVLSGGNNNNKDWVNKEIMKHHVITVIFTCDRGVSHELVRHRPASYDQESTRYCDYSKDKFGNEITVIFPEEYAEDEVKYAVWANLCEASERAYFKLRDLGATPQEARGVLVTDLKTEIVVTANELEWQHIINMRYHETTGAAHPHMKSVMSKAFPLIVAASNNRVV